MAHTHAIIRPLQRFSKSDHFGFTFILLRFMGIVDAVYFSGLFDVKIAHRFDNRTSGGMTSAAS